MTSATCKSPIEPPDKLHLNKLLDESIEKFPTNDHLIEKTIKPLLHHAGLTKDKHEELQTLLEDKVKAAFKPVMSKMNGASGIHLHKKLVELACKTALTVNKISPNLIDDKFFIENYTEIKDPYGRNLLMTLWDSDLEELIPNYILKKNYMLERDNYGSTCLHIAAIHQKLDKVPIEIRTKSNLINIKDKEGNNILHRAILGLKGILDPKTKDILTSKNLLTKNKVNMTPMDTLLENFDPTRDKENVKHLCKILPKSKIIGFRKRYKDPKSQGILSRELTIRTLKTLKKMDEELEP